MTTRSAAYLRLGCAILAIGAGLLGAGCEHDELSDEPFGVIDLAPYYADGATPRTPAAGLPRIVPQRGFASGDRAEFYDFGLVPYAAMGSTPTAAPVNPMYVFFDERKNPLLAAPVRDERTGLWLVLGGNPTMSPNQTSDADRSVPHSLRRKRTILDPKRSSSAHQRPIVDVGPESLGTVYTGLWEIVEVIAQAGYEPDAIKSKKTLDEALARRELTARPTGKVINCPLLDERQDVVPSAADPGVVRPRLEVWYRRKLGSCLLVNGWETLARDGQLIGAGEDAARLNTFDVMVGKTLVGTEAQRTIVVPIGRMFIPGYTKPDLGGTVVLRHPQNWIVEDRPRRTEADPPGYSPMRWMWDVMVGEALPAGGMRSVAEIEDKEKKARAPAPAVRNAATIGNVVTCGTTQEDGTCSAADACAPLGLSCNVATCTCDVPEVGFGEVCAPGFQRCRTAPLGDEEAAYAPRGYVCHPKEGRGFCIPKCDATAPNDTKEKGEGGQDLDSRCGNLPGLVCVTPTGDDKKESVCIRRCSTTAPEAVSGKVCRAPLVVDVPRADGSTEGVDLARTMRCASIRGVSGCQLDDALEPR